MKPVLKIILIWAAWALILSGYQALVQMRFAPQHPDLVFQWTVNETKPGSHANQPYLIEPFLNQHVAWDSEFYLSIATNGYDDPAVRAIPPSFAWVPPPKATFCTAGEDNPCYSLSYAFFPFYPLVTRLVSLPLKLLALTPIAAATLAGVIVSLLGALGAMIALFDLVRAELGEATGLRAACYLAIFPSGFFLAQVYTEGLFVGLAFGALALLRRRQWLLAALLAVAATWTRAVGALLVIPFLWTWWQAMQTGDPDQSAWGTFFDSFSWRSAGLLGIALSPVLAFGAWRHLLGKPFHIVEELFFGRGFLLLGASLSAWSQAWVALGGENLQTRVYYTIEFAAILFGLLSCVLVRRRYPAMALFGAAVILISLLSGQAQGMHRYVLAVPSIFLVLGSWGKNEVFDRSWTLLSVLLMGLMAMLFTFDFWAG
jgi:hypothetical protein